MLKITGQAIRLAIVGVSSLIVLRHSFCEIYEIKFLFVGDSWVLSMQFLRLFCTCPAWTNNKLEMYKFLPELCFCLFLGFFRTPVLIFEQKLMNILNLIWSTKKNSYMFSSWKVTHVKCTKAYPWFCILDWLSSIT